MGLAKFARRKRRLRKIRRFLLIVVGVAVVGSAFYFGATWGPKSVDSDRSASGDSANPALLEESQRLFREFEEIADTREPTDKDLGLLRQAIAAQRDYNLTVRSDPSDRRRLEEMENRLGHFEAQEIHRESLAAEEEGKRLLEEEQVADAMEKLQLAYDLQRQVNKHYGRGAFRDAMRENRLEKTLVSMESQPLHERSVELEEQAEQAVEGLEWDHARQLFTEALELQERINEGSRQSAYYNASRSQQLTQKIDRLQVGEMMSESRNLEEEAQRRESDGEWERAAELYEQAMVIQNEINRDHPQSPYVTRERVIELAAARQTALSTPLARQLDEALRKIRQALVDSDYPVVRENVEKAGSHVARLAERFPHSRYTDYDVRREVEYLGLVEAVLPDLQDLLRQDLLPLPGNESWRMSRGPVSQTVYSRVMNGNPSRNPGENLPVDSITLRQAQEFCRRASWILAQPVTLPKRAHFETALGEWDPETYANLSWHKENSDGVSHPVGTGVPNSHGFLHLVGNVQFWLGDSAEDGSALAAGASYAEEFPPQDLFQRIGKNERAPTVGFRYVVGAAEG